MKNKEKYRDEIIKAIKEHEPCYSFIGSNILNSYGLSCNQVESCHMCHLLCGIWLEEEYKEPEVDWTEVEVDTPILVKDYNNAAWEKRHFAKYENGKVLAWNGGRTSFSETTYCAWNIAKLAEEEENE